VSVASTDNGVASTILRQLGGWKFINMTGATYVVGDENSLAFSLPRKRGYVKNAINKVRITLDPSDTYTIKFMKVGRRNGGFDIKIVAETSDIYCDVLQEVFTRHTGLTTRVF